MKTKSETTEHLLRRRRITAVVSLCLVLLLLLWLTIVLYQRLFEIGATPEDFKSFIDSFGWIGWLVALGIQMLQVLVALIPGEVVEIGIGCAFGAVEGTVICLGGVAIASAVVFLLTRRFGIRLLELFFPVESINSLRFINSEKKLHRTVFLLFFIPGTPKDLLTYFVGLTRIKLSTFLIISLIARIPSVVSSVIGGDLISDRNYSGAVLLFAITGVVSLLGMQLYTLLLRRKRFSGVSKDGIKVIQLFLKICAIPHGSGNTLKLAAFCMRFAKRYHLQADMDAAGNVWIKKPASRGYEHRPEIVLQAHLDMVCEKDADNRIRFDKQAITPVFDGDFLRADGTTLGADNGIGLSMILSILRDKHRPHPALQALLTVDEETGMKGAMALDGSRLHGRTLINLDSEEEGVLTVGCAGGVRASARFPVVRRPITGQAVTVTLSGLTGGHSGMDIHKGRANANTLLISLLRDWCGDFPLALSSLNGGAVDNAIPISATATVLLPSRVSDFCRRVKQSADALTAKWKNTDPQLTLTVETGEQGTVTVVPVEDTKRLLDTLATLPDGVQTESRQFPGKPETSLNFGILSMEEDRVSTVFALRSFRDTALASLSEQLQRIVETAGGVVELGAGYPSWEYRDTSWLVERAVAVYTAQYGTPPVLDAVHAGLECGAFCGKQPQLTCISLGPDITAVHTPQEKVSLTSADRVYRYLCTLLADRE